MVFITSIICCDGGRHRDAHNNLRQLHISGDGWYNDLKLQIRERDAAREEHRRGTTLSEARDRVLPGGSYAALCCECPCKLIWNLFNAF